MQLQQITKNEPQTYQSFVQANGSFLQSLEWGDFQASIGQEVLRYMVSDDSGTLILSVQLLVREFRNKKYLYAPYGPVIAKEYLPRVQEIQGALTFLMQQLYTKDSAIIFVRIEPFNLFGFETLPAGLVVKKTIDLNPHQTSVLDLTQSLEQLQAAMHPKTRYNIKVAEKKDIRISAERKEADQALNLFITTSKRAGISSFPKKYYQDLLSFFSNTSQGIQAKLYTAWHQKDLLASNLIIYYAGRAIYLFGGSADIKRNLMAPYLLHWQAISDAKNIGFRTYDFWGIETDPKHPWYGFSKFKMGFGGKVLKYAGTWDFVLQPAWYNVYALLRAANRVRNRLINRTS